MLSTGFVLGSERRKGTLLYDTGGLELGVCYFGRARPRETCATVGPVLKHDSLFDYYRHKYPDLEISPDDVVVDVSFRGLPGPVPVAAKLLRLRIMPDKGRSFSGLANFKTSSPFSRKEETEGVWEICRDTLEDELGLRFEDELWRPADRDHELLPCPELQFRSGRTVAPPAAPTVEEYRRYYNDRMGRLKGGGLYHFEPSIERRVFLVTPTKASGWSDELQTAYEQGFGGV